MIREVSELCHHIIDNNMVSINTTDIITQLLTYLVTGSCGCDVVKIATLTPNKACVLLFDSGVWMTHMKGCSRLLERLMDSEQGQGSTLKAINESQIK